MTILLKNVRYFIEDIDKIHSNIQILIQNRKYYIYKNLKDVPKVYEKEINCKNKIVTFGFSNFHTHLAMIIFRGLNDDSELHDWLKSIWKLEDILTKKEIFYGSILGLYEFLKHGILFYIDMYFHTEMTAKANELFKIYGGVGIPIISYNFEDRLKKMERFYNKYKNSKYNLPIVNVHSIYLASPKEIKIAKEFANEYNLLFNIHASETRKEVIDSLKKYKTTPIELLNNLNILDNKTILAHCTWISKKEISYVSKRKSIVVHCPTSNMKLAGGTTMPYLELKNSKCIVTLGTDGAASNNSYDLFLEMKFMSLLQKHHYWDPLACTAKDTLNSAIFLPRKLMISYLNLEKNSIFPGMIGININNIRLYPLKDYNLFSNLVYSATGDTVSFVINKEGDILYFNRKIINNNIKKYVQKAKRYISDFLDKNV